MCMDGGPGWLSGWLLQGGAADAAAYANGSAASGEGESKRAQRLRSVYQHMRQVSLLDSDRAMLVRPARLPACMCVCLSRGC